jgi:uncharacterized protein YjbI with pentapeptide repeats
MRYATSELTRAQDGGLLSDLDSDFEDSLFDESDFPDSDFDESDLEASDFEDSDFDSDLPFEPLVEGDFPPLP